MRAIASCKPRGVARHAAFIPEQEAKLAMKRIDRALAIDVEHSLGARPHVVLSLHEFRMIGRRPFADLTGEIIRQRVGQHEIAVGQSLHERAGAETIRAVIGKIRFADHMQSRGCCSSNCSPPTIRPWCNGPPG